MPLIPAMRPLTPSRSAAAAPISAPPANAERVEVAKAESCMFEDLARASTIIEGAETRKAPAKRQATLAAAHTPSSFK